MSHGKIFKISFKSKGYYMYMNCCSQRRSRILRININIFVYVPLTCAKTKALSRHLTCI